MPIYEYVCPSCGHPFEKRVSFSESDEPQTCPVCGNEHARRQISLVGFTSGESSRGSVRADTSCGPVG
jgi:putative FmdB family regulatory protein